MSVFYLSGLSRAGECDGSKMTIDQAAREVLAKLHKKYPPFQAEYRTMKVVKLGVESDVIKCRLMRMGLNNTSEWLEKNRGIKISKSSLGRFQKKLSSIDIATELFPYFIDNKKK